MKIVVLDAHALNPGDLSWDWLKTLGECEIYDRTPESEVITRCEGAEIVITNKTPLPKFILEKLPLLKFIALESTGYNVVDTEYCKERGIPVCNIPSYSTEAVAQLTFSLILEITNGVALHSESVKNGEWTSCPDFCYWKIPLSELSGKMLGIVGFGQIGSRVADIANAFNMNVIAVSGHETDQSHRKNFRWATLDELKKQADIITFHCPLNKNTENLCNEEFLNGCRDGVIIINTSRGPVIDEHALAEALKSGKVRGAGVDVLSTEPPRKDNPLLSAPNCFITPHIAWAGFETRKRLMDILESNVKAYLNGTPQNVVNK
ncbi:MAG: D-2-hydroxyacid dehydrogenase [Oscillospiraceae bacterium]|nr:D-2-hydroxyacid dehydrogenase [Oscillospiraceae bacterium]